MEDSLETNAAESSLATSRSRRNLPDKHGRMAAFAKFKNLKGSKHKYQVSEVAPVYEEVDEKEYSRRRQDKMENDWIVDDDGSGYVEDGREIFDEEDDVGDAIFTSKKDARRHAKKKEEKSSGQPSIRSLLSNMPVRKRKAESEVSLADDELLGDILDEMTSSLPKPSLAKKPRPSMPPQQQQCPVNPFASKRTQSPIGKVPAVNNQSAATNGASRTSKTYLSQSPASEVEPRVKPGSVNQSPACKIEAPVSSNTSSQSQKDSPKSGVNAGTRNREKRPSPAGGTPSRGAQQVVPRPVFRENLPASSPPKAKRSLAVEAAKVETEADFADMDFSALDDMEDDALSPPRPVAADKPAVEENKEKKGGMGDIKVPAAHRGFTASMNVKEDGYSGSLQWETTSSAPVSAEAAQGERVAVPEISFDVGKLPLTDVNGEKVVRMYWLDAHEEPHRQPGTVFLFGKVWLANAAAPGGGQHVSCCCTVRNIERRIYLLPRTKKTNPQTGEESEEDVTMKDVYDEFNDVVTRRLGIKEFRSRPVTKGYAFDHLEVPDQTQYLEVRYSAAWPAVPADLRGTTFSRAFGHSSGPLETLLLDLKLRGPCWLDLLNPAVPSPPLSWCKLEVTAESPCNVRVSSCSDGAPPVVVLTLHMRTVLNPSTRQSEVAAVGCLVHPRFPLDKPPPNPPYTEHFCVLTKPSDAVWPWDLKTQLQQYRHAKVHKTDTERALLGFLLSRIQLFDPDVITGHDVLGYDLGVLLHRLQANKVPHWSRVGRLRRAIMPKLNSRGGYGERSAVCGRLVCDVLLSARELIRARSYDLPALAGQVLAVPSPQAPPDHAAVRKMFETSESLLRLVSVSMECCLWCLRLMCELCVLPLALQITNIAGNVMSRTLLGGRSERNEFLLLHAFTENNFIPPDRQQKAKAPVVDKEAEDLEETAAPAGGGRRKAAYAGGLVLEPKKGYYDKYILLMDFNSLYPSIIQEYNICFTTIDRRKLRAKNHGDEPQQVDLPEGDQALGVLPTEIRKLVDSRRSVKQLMKKPDLSPVLRMQYDIRQKALKLTANSMYGCLGFSHSRFHAAHLAAMVTGKGREILLQTRDLVHKLNFDVIYGDTDSIMVNTNSIDYDQVFKLGSKIKSEVNKLYRLLELDIDGVYRYMLLLKKKKYAALTVSKAPSGELVTQQELKGLDIVRRDWSQVASEAGKHVINQILSDQGPDERIANIHAHLEGLARRLNEGQVELRELVVTKQLTKRPDDYPDKAALPHVQVALRLNAASARKFKQGDTVPYVVCKDGTDRPTSQRAYHPEELKKNPDLSVDTHYYLAHQLHPVIARLCDPIEGSDAARIAECLGLDPSTYRSGRQYSHDDDGEQVGEGCELPPEERFRGCAPFSYTCPVPECGTRVVVDAPFTQSLGGRQDPFLLRCPNPKCGDSPLHHLVPLTNCLTRQLRGHVKSYYDGWLVCEDPGCSNRCRRTPLRFVRGFPVCNLCHKGVLLREYSEGQLYKQLSYYDYILDFPLACAALKDDRVRDTELRKAYATLRAEVQKVLTRSAYSHVDLGVLFANLMVKK